MAQKDKRRRGGRYTPHLRNRRGSSVSVHDAAVYLAEYITCYRQEYARFTAPPPEGPGYPPLDVSPYVSGVVDCFLSTDGAIVAVFGPDSDIECLQTAAMKRESSRETPADVGAMTIGEPDLDIDIANGVLPLPTAQCRVTNEAIGVDIRVAQFELALTPLLQRLLASAWVHNTEPELAPFWMSFIARRLVFKSVAEKVRYFEYLEILEHVDPAAWEPRAAALRAHVDVRRDFAATAANPTGSGRLSGAASPAVRASFGDAVFRLESAINGLESLLEHPNEVE